MKILADKLEDLLRRMGWYQVSRDPALWAAPDTSHPRYTTEIAIHKATLGVVKAERKT
jgi:hypothetical protein